MFWSLPRDPTSCISMQMYHHAAEGHAELQPKSLLPGLQQGGAWSGLQVQHKMDGYAAGPSGYDQLPHSRVVASVPAWGGPPCPQARQQHLPQHQSQAQLNPAQWQPDSCHQAGPQWQHQQPISGWHDHPQILPGAGVRSRAPGAPWQQQQQLGSGWHDNLQERSGVQIHTRAPETSEQQQLPGLGWHDSPLEPSRAGPYRVASSTSWQEHQRRGDTAGASGRCLHHMCPIMLYEAARTHTLAFKVALPCCPKTQPRKQPLSCIPAMCRT